MGSLGAMVVPGRCVASCSDAVRGLVGTCLHREGMICLCVGGIKAGGFPDLPAWRAGRRCGRRASISRCCSPQKFSNRQINSEMVAVREQGEKEKKYSGRASALRSHITACYYEQFCSNSLNHNRNLY